MCFYMHPGITIDTNGHEPPSISTSSGSKPARRIAAPIAQAPNFWGDIKESPSAGFSVVFSGSGCGWLLLRKKNGENAMKSKSM